MRVSIYKKEGFSGIGNYQNQDFSGKNLGKIQQYKIDYFSILGHKNEIFQKVRIIL